MLQDVKSYLGKCFAMKDLGETAYILGIKIYTDRSRRSIGLCQSAYIEKILKIYFKENSKCRTIPMQEKLKLRSIMYAVRCTLPDVAFAQNITSRFQQNPGELHWTTVKNILKYLRNTKDMFLVYGGDQNESTGFRYTDAGYLTMQRPQVSYWICVRFEWRWLCDWKVPAKHFRYFISKLSILLHLDASKEL
ncbi:hypothetical protein Tco_1533562 [Tanacetum coccineum]